MACIGDARVSTTDRDLDGQLAKLNEEGCEVVRSEKVSGASREGRQDVRYGIISIRAEKTGEELFIPILPPLASSIAAAPTGDLAFIVGSDGKPFVKESFGNGFRDVCLASGCRGSAHGLHKAGAVRAAEAAASNRELMALYGWTIRKDG